jgi:hypothetical protein
MNLIINFILFVALIVIIIVLLFRNTNQTHINVNKCFNPCHTNCVDKKGARYGDFCKNQCAEYCGKMNN